MNDMNDNDDNRKTTYGTRRLGLVAVMLAMALLTVAAPSVSARPVTEVTRCMDGTVGQKVDCAGGYALGTGIGAGSAVIAAIQEACDQAFGNC